VTPRSRPYRHSARYYRARPPYSSELRPRLSALLRWDGSGRLLDIGCGPGLVALDLAPSFTEVVGLDPEPEMLTEARKNTPASEVGRVRWVLGRAEDIALLGLGHFDAVTLAQSFHWTDREFVADLVYDCLVPGGAMLVISHDTKSGIEPSGNGSDRGDHPPVPHGVIREVLERYLPATALPPPTAPLSGPNAERHESVISRTRFGAPERLLLPGRTDLVRTVDEVIDAYLGTAFAAPDHFGDRLDAFRAELATALQRHTDTGRFSWWAGETEVLVARKHARARPDRPASEGSPTEDERPRQR
jgi:ubiquinone/menaquinone biosynthesis C-methylase UbiE